MSGATLGKPMLVRILRWSRHPCCSPRAAAQQVSFPAGGLPLTEGAAHPTSIPATLSLPRRAVGPVPAVVIGSSEGARRIRRRLRLVLEARR
jgi:hypothetical protein